MAFICTPTDHMTGMHRPQADPAHDATQPLRSVKRRNRPVPVPQCSSTDQPCSTQEEPQCQAPASDSSTAPDVSAASERESAAPAHEPSPTIQCRAVPLAENAARAAEREKQKAAIRRRAEEAAEEAAREAAQQQEWAARHAEVERQVCRPHALCC